MSTKNFIVFMLVALISYIPLQAQSESSQPEDIEATRSELMKRWGVDGLVKPAEIDAAASLLLGRSLAEQTDEELLGLAKQANIAANLVGFILEEYEQYYRENYRYDFVQEKVVPFHTAYTELANRLKSYRNQAYLNLGRKAVNRGDEMVAFFYFRDAYRLSSFTEPEGDHKGIRFQAEVEMKRLLGLDDMGSFLYWK